LHLNAHDLAAIPSSFSSAHVLRVGAAPGLSTSPLIRILDSKQTFSFGVTLLRIIKPNMSIHLDQQSFQKKIFLLERKLERKQQDVEGKQKTIEDMKDRIVSLGTTLNKRIEP